MFNILPAPANFVGFSVYRTSGSASYSAGDVLKFARHFFAESTYDTISGEFRCPTTGIYFITFTLWKNFDKDLVLGVEHNNAIILHAINTNVKNFRNPITNSRLVSCVEDDTLVVKGVADGEAWPETFQLFSGMLYKIFKVNT